MQMDRRRFLKLILSGAVAPSLTAAGSTSILSNPDKHKYNVLFVAVDDLNDWVGCLGGHPQAKTPNIDRLAKSGVLFEQAYCAAPLCNPSRTAIMTGLNPSTTGIYGNRAWFRDHPKFKDWQTIPQYFRKQGYTAWTGGKVYHQPDGKWSDPIAWNRQYSKSVGTPAPPLEERYRHGMRGKLSNRIVQSLTDWAPIEQTAEETNDWRTADLAAQFLRQEHDKPFIIREHGQWKNAVQGYLAACSFADACVGRVLDALEKSAYRDSTIVVLWGDHGYHLGEKDHFAKSALWEETSRTPLIIRAPGVSKRQRRCKRPVGLVDIYPTLIELCGLPGRDGLDGRSLAPLVRDPEADWPYPALITHSPFWYGTNHAIHSQRYHYIRYRDGGEELYDNAADPYGWKNLADDPKYAEAKEKLKKWLPKVNAEHFRPEASR